MMLKRGWAILGKESKFCIFCIKMHILIWNTELITEEVLNDSVMLQTELGRFRQKMKILHKIAYFDLER